MVKCGVLFEERTEFLNIIIIIIIIIIIKYYLDELRLQDVRTEAAERSPMYLSLSPLSYYWYAGFKGLGRKMKIEGKQRKNESEVRLTLWRRSCLT
jgi:hypothetical protein